MTLVFLIKALFSFVSKTKTVVMSFKTIKGLLIIPFSFVSFYFLQKLNLLELSLLILLGLMSIDFVTGIIASYFLKKKAEKENPELKKKRLISSEKLKMSGVKFLLYSVTILSAHSINKTFLIKTFKFDFSAVEFTITIFVISWWCVVEFYSIVFENFKDMGIDVKDQLIKVFNSYKSIKNQIKNN